MNNNTLLEATKKFGTPIYVYNSEKIRAQYTRLTKAFKQVKKLQLNYAVKALSNISVLKYAKNVGVESGISLHSGDKYQLVLIIFVLLHE